LLTGLGVRLQVLRKHLHWYATASSSTYRDSPVFFYDTPNGYYYGFPPLDANGIKLAEHSGGEPLADASLLSRQIDLAEQHRVEQFLQRYLLQATRQHMRHETCMYTMTSDQHFLVDMHPQFPNVAFAAGLSGHGFKFASVLGEILADLVQHQTSPHATRFLSIGRLIDSQA
jgi:glycine/D-amino acid oxidase-like deaminating enzyme